MRKALVITFVILLSVPVFAVERMISGGIAAGNEYSSGFVSVLLKRPNALNFGVDASLFNFGAKGTTSHSYYANLYTQNKLFSQYDLLLDWIAGVTFTRSDFQTFSTTIVTTPGIGIAGQYPLSPTWLLNGKLVGIIYSDGYSLPYQLGVTYPFKGFGLTVGFQGLIAITTAGGASTSSNNFGLMLGLQY